MVHIQAPVLHVCMRFLAVGAALFPEYTKHLRSTRETFDCPILRSASGAAARFLKILSHDLQDRINRISGLSRAHKELIVAELQRIGVDYVEMAYPSWAAAWETPALEIAQRSRGFCHMGALAVAGGGAYGRRAESVNVDATLCLFSLITPDVVGRLMRSETATLVWQTIELTSAALCATRALERRPAQSAQTNSLSRRPSQPT